MDSVSARNQFIIENYDRLYRICCTCAYRMMRRFPSLSFQDLIGYGFEGVIISVDRGDSDSPAFFAYISRYCYLTTLSGAFQMIGITRKMKKTYSPAIGDAIPHEVLFEPSKIEQLIENNHYNISYEECDKLYHYMEIRWFISMLPDCLEKEILIKLANHHSVIETAKLLNIPVRKMRKLALHITLIYQLVFMGKPFEHLLTSYSLKPSKRFYIHSENTHKKTAFYSRYGTLYRNRRKYVHSEYICMPPENVCLASAV